jgi:hypothetical protein
MTVREARAQEKRKKIQRKRTLSLARAELLFLAREINPAESNLLRARISLGRVGS